MAIPKDPMILMSYVNTQLRDFYSSLDELCSALDLNREELEERLGTVDFHYNKEKNQFV